MLPICSARAGRRIDKTVSIIDLKGVKITKIFDHKFKKFLKSITHISQNYYPELLHEMYIINAPFIFTGIWNIIKLMIDKDIQKKIHIYSNTPKKLHENVFIKEFIPDFFEGQCHEPLHIEPGPWKSYA